MDHVYAVFAFGSENWSLDHTDDGKDQRIGNQTKTMTRYSFSKDKKEETWVEYHVGTCNMARKIWLQMGLSFLHEKMQKVCGEPLDGFVMKSLFCDKLHQKFIVEKYDMVAQPADENDRRRSG